MTSFIRPRAFPPNDTTVTSGNLEAMLLETSKATGVLHADAFGGYDQGPTKEQAITAAIAFAVTNNIPNVLIPLSMTPYNAALVTFNSAVRMQLEGAAPGVNDVRGWGSLAAAIGNLPGGNGTIFVPDTYSETLVSNLTISGSLGVRIQVMPGAQITIGTGGSITLLNQGVWEQPGGIITVTKTSGDAVIMSGKTSRFILGQLNGPNSGTGNGIVFVGAQFSRVDVGAIQNFGGLGLLFGRTGQAAGTLSNHAFVEFINGCGSSCTFASGVLGTDATPFCEGNRVWVSFSVFSVTAGVTFGDSGTLHDCEFNEFHGDVHDTSAGGIVPVIFNDGQYCYYDGSVFTNNGSVRCTLNTLAKFNIVRCANIGVTTNINGIGLYQNLIMSELFFQVAGTTGGGGSPIILPNSSYLFSYAADLASLAGIARIFSDNFVHLGDNSRQISADTGTSYPFKVVASQCATVALVSGTAPAINALAGDYQELSVLTNIAAVIAAPTNTPGTGFSQILTVTIFNGSGGALTTAPTFATGAGAFLLSAAAVNPANGTGVTYVFRWSPGAAGGARYREIARTAAF